jgi:ribosomal protein L11 methyltransferase
MQTEQEQWFVVSVTVPPEASEAIEFAFNELNSGGTEINNLRRDQSEDVTVAGYFDAIPAEETLTAEITEALRIYGFSPDVIRKVEQHPVENADWLHAWKQHWKPTAIGRFIITPPWEKVETTDKIVIEIEPAMAFGTGTHETTRLCLGAIGENYQSGQSFLDVGTGTGILAIAAAKMGATGILACDTDPGSIDNARENATMNRVAQNIEFYVGGISDETPAFDFVCANLTLDVILPIRPLLIAKTRQILVLSGVLQEQEDTIIKTLAGHHTQVFHSGEWISVLVNKSV